jgi:hypothetical protein
MAQSKTQVSAARARSNRSVRGLVATYLHELATRERPTPKVSAPKLAPEPSKS